jgi:hypothetical protein
MLDEFDQHFNAVAPADIAEKDKFRGYLNSDPGWGDIPKKRKEWEKANPILRNESIGDYKTRMRDALAPKWNELFNLEARLAKWMDENDPDKTKGETGRDHHKYRIRALQNVQYKALALSPQEDETPPAYLRRIQAAEMDAHPSVQRFFEVIEPEMEAQIMKQDVYKNINEGNEAEKSRREADLRAASLTKKQNDERIAAIDEEKKRIVNELVDCCLKAKPTHEFREYFELSPKYFQRLNDLNSFILSEKAVLGWNENKEAVKRVVNAQRQLDKLKNLDDKTIEEYYEFRFGIIDNVQYVEKPKGLQMIANASVENKVETRAIITYF